MSASPLPLANGLHTDHPIPGLPFVDDSHLPLGDPRALEAIGRRDGGVTWGRYDEIQCEDSDGWAAFTTDPMVNALAWYVRWHPRHGRSVSLYRDDDVSMVHSEMQGPALLFRAGGYWWDGVTWYRPAQVFDRASEQYARRPVPAAVTITAGDLLAGNPPQSKPDRLLRVDQINLDSPSSAYDGWLDDLAMWAERRHGERDGLPLAECVVNLEAPELTSHKMVRQGELAEIAGISGSTLRAYIARGESEVPRPQAAVAGRSAWSRPVAQDWAEQRRRDSLDEVVSTRHDRTGTDHPVGVADAWSRFTCQFFTTLWGNPRLRRRWALRWRNPAAVTDVAEELGWDVAASLGRIIPVNDLAGVLRHAILAELTDSDMGLRCLHPGTARMLDWLIRHDPHAAAGVIGEIIGEAERSYGINHEESERTLKEALSWHGKLDQPARDEFLARTFTPAASS